MNRINPYLFAAVYVAAIFLLASCMTPRQTAAAQVLQDLFAQGILTREQLNALLAALSPSTWVSDVIDIGKLLLTGYGSVLVTNVVRNRARVARGEPVGTRRMPKKKAIEDPLAPDGLHDDPPAS